MMSMILRYEKEITPTGMMSPRKNRKIMYDVVLKFFCSQFTEQLEHKAYVKLAQANIIFSRRLPDISTLAVIVSPTD